MNFRFVSFITLCLFVVTFVGCDSSGHETLEGKPVLTQNEVKSTLNDLALQLASERSWLDQTAATTLTKTALHLGQTNVSYPSSIYRKDNDGKIREYLITLEPNGKNGVLKLSKTLDGGAYRIALDPDQFYLPEDPNEELWTSRPVLEIPTFLYVEGGEPVEEVVLHGPGVEPDEPLFFITLKERYEEPVVAAKIATGTYLTYRGCDLRYDTDNNNEEFELYFAVGNDPMGSPFLSSTTHMFDGASRLDASGVYRTYPDINYIDSGNEWDVTPENEICLRLLDGNIFRLTAIEDDQIIGKFVRNQAANSLSKFSIDYYNMADATVVLNLESNFTVHQRNDDADDRLPSAGVMGINDLNLTLQIGSKPYMQTDDYVGQYHLTSLNWKFAKKVIN